jgi:hypothetical protein
MIYLGIDLTKMEEYSYVTFSRTWPSVFAVTPVIWEFSGWVTFDAYEVVLNALFSNSKCPSPQNEIGVFE